MSKSLLKESIAEAKTIRELALKQAKAYLEEAFAPQVKSMISRKIQQEMEDDEEKELEEPVEEEITNDAGAQVGTDDEHEKAEKDSGLTEQEDTSNIGAGDNKEPSKEASDTTTKDEEGPTDVKSDHDEAKESELTEQEEPVEDEPEEDDLDLEQVVAELEAEEDEESLDEPVVGEDEDLEFDVEDDEEEVPAEEPVGEAEEEVPAAEDDEELDIDIEDDEEPVATEAEAEVPAEVPAEEEEEEDDEIDNFVGEAKIKSLQTELTKNKAKLAKAIEVVRYMKNKLNEVNVLNAKLLFTNKVFRNFALDNKSKMKVVENFDRAKSIREIKLVYATLMENLGVVNSPNKTQRIVEGASRSVGTTKVKVDEEIVKADTNVRDRIHKLANIKMKK